MTIRKIFASALNALPRFVWFVVGTVFGAVLSLGFIPWFVALIPGPTVTASVHGLRPVIGNGIGCIYYYINLSTNEPIEFVYLKLQFPTQIENYKVGSPQETESMGGRTSLQTFEAGRNAQGRCAVIQASGDNNTEVQASASAHMIALHASKLSPKTMIPAIVATDENKSSAKPNPKLYTEGSYEYIKLGQTVRKPLLISDEGVKDAK